MDPVGFRGADVGIGIGGGEEPGVGDFGGEVGLVLDGELAFGGGGPAEGVADVGVIAPDEAEAADGHVVAGGWGGGVGGFFLVVEPVIGENGR